jgi:gliding motility-associated-like protein
MEGKDSIKELFSQKLGNHEVPVSPELWSSVSSQISTVGGSNTIGLSTLSKIIIGSSIAASIVVSSYFLIKNSDDSDNKIKTKENTSNKPVKVIRQENEQNKSNSITEKRIDIRDNNTNSELSSIVKNDIELTTKNQLESITISENSTMQEDKNVASSSSEIKDSHNPSPTDYQKEENVMTENVQNQITNSNFNTSSSVETNYPPKSSEIMVNLPNVFTPNGDGKNDYLEIETKNIEDFSIVVLNEKGQSVFQSSDIEFKWDGRMPNGDLVESGTFVYYITGKDFEGKLITRYSRLTVKY